jgi:hypothetical protein
VLPETNNSLEETVALIVRRYSSTNASISAFEIARRSPSCAVPVVRGPSLRGRRVTPLPLTKYSFGVGEVGEVPGVAALFAAQERHRFGAAASVDGGGRGTGAAAVAEPRLFTLDECGPIGGSADESEDRRDSHVDAVI